MANSTQIKTGFNALQQSHLSVNLKNTIFNRMPLIYFLLNRDGDKSGVDGLGVPKTGMLLSGVETAKARKEEILGASVYEPIIQTAVPSVSDGKVLGMYDALPRRSNWTANPTSSYFTRPRVKWVERADPYKVANKEIRRTTNAAKGDNPRAWQAVTSMFNAETVSVLGQQLTWWNQSLWGSNSNLGPSNEDAVVWDQIHPLKVALDDGNTYSTYCGVDKTTSTGLYFKGPTTTGYTTADFEGLINYCNYDLGISKKGTGIDLLLVDGSNFKKAKSEAKSKGFQLIYNGGIPDFGQFGFKREIVKIDNTYVVYDPECPTGHVAALNLGTWTFAIHPNANFKVSEPFDQSKIEGGDDAMAGTIRTELMLVCEAPSLNAYFTSIA